MTGGKFKLLILASHPIQYQCPFFKELSGCSEIDLTVYFCSNWGVEKYFDAGFGRTFKWDTNLLEGFNHEVLKNYSLFPNPSTFFGLVNWDLIQKLKKEKFNVVWIHGWNSFSNLLAMFICFLRGIPVLLRSETTLLPHLPEYKIFLKKLILSNLFKRISAFLAIGTYNKEFYVEYGVPKEKIFLVPYSVNNDYFISKANELIPQKEKLRKKYNIPADNPAILFSGKLISKKNPFDLLKAFEIVSKEINSSLVFVGDGGLRKELEQYVVKNQIKNVYFMGFRNQTELPDFYSLADVFVLPSGFEPWGLVVNEAMCFGLPVIVSDQVGAGGDLVVDGENGYIFSVGNINTLSKYLIDFLQNETKRKEFGLCSKEKIKRWSYEEEIKGLIKALKTL